MESDERFKHLAKDPRFRVLRKPKTVEIDERFQSMFTDAKFIPKNKDKRGHDTRQKLKKRTKPKQNLRPRLNKEGSKGDDDSDETDEKVEDEDEVSDEEEESEIESSSSDESESDEDENDLPDHLDVENLETYDWQALDEDAERTDETTKRLAIQHMDWDRLDVRDIYTLVNSVRPPRRVRVYVSEFGKERLKQEQIEGPKELVDRPKLDEEEEEYRMLEEKMKAMENPKSGTNMANEYEDADEALDPKNEEIRERIRKYQLSKMKYYYAIVEFDSVDSAEAVYKELDGMEYEGSSLELDLRFVPDDVKFDDADIKAECDKLPDLTTYKAPLFINTALQQTTVKLTWDETDMKRQEKLLRAYTKEELDKDDLEEYLASGDDDDEDESDDQGKDEDNDQIKDKSAETTKKGRSAKYQELLRSLDEEEGRKKKVDLEVDWDGGSDESSGDSSGDDDDASSSSSSSAVSAASVLSETASSKSKASDSAQLDLMLMNDEKSKDFEFNPDDERFKAVYTSRLYNIDPSHPNFKRTKAFDMIAERKRRKTTASGGSTATTK